MPTTPLEHRLKALIRLNGPLSIADYMAICLGDPDYGYYMARDPFGPRGDFVTAPEVSQMFGELLGLWAVDLWMAAGQPPLVHLVELGPGRGTLMIDAMRAAGVAPAFMAAVHVHMIESSPRLTAVQWDRLAAAGIAADWHDRIDRLPPGPIIVIANEFFDALPIRQFQRMQGIWRERVVGLDAEDRLTFGVGATVLPSTDIPADLASSPDGAILEMAPIAFATMEALGARIARSGLGLIAIDYGYATTAIGDSFQAVRAHKPVDPLLRPGEADLTAHVNFDALARAAERSGAIAHGVVEQGDFLLRLGLAERAGRLGANKDKAARDQIVADVNRLVGSDEMGSLFKVLAVTARGLKPAGF